MTSRELVQRAVNFTGPERLPFDTPASGPTDVARVGGGRSSDPRVRQGPGGLYYDHFGCGFAKLNERTMGQPTDPPLPDLSDLSRYRFPDPADPGRLGPLAAALEKVGDKYVAASVIWFTFFERMHFLHGFTATMEDLYARPGLLQDLAERITDYNVAVVEEVARLYPDRIHAISMSDDWGSQSGPFISLRLFRDLFLPHYRRLFAAIRGHGMDVWLHSCGQVMEFIPDLIDAGVQVLNLQQPRIFDIAELGRRFAGRVCFNVPVDIQATMPRGSLADIREEARLLLHHLATKRGGFIVNEHTDYVGNGIDPEKGVWAYEAFRDADPYRRVGKTGR